MNARASRYLALTALLLAALANLCRGYALIGGSWPSGNIPVQLALDATAPTSPRPPLTDGSTSWNAVAEAAVAEWNGALASSRSHLAPSSSSATSSQLHDGRNSILFASRTYDGQFDTYTLAVTITDSEDGSLTDTVRIREADLIVNNQRTWNSYRGATGSNPLDLRRVVLHELGHVLGLDHPDLAVPAQSVTSLMNSIISNLDTLQADDRSGAAYLYNTPLVPLTAGSITRQPVSQTAGVSSPVAFSIALNGGTPPEPAPALLSYNWYFKATGTSTFEKLFTLNTPLLNLGSVQSLDAGSYYLEVMTPDLTVRSSTVALTVNPVTTTPATALANLSTRGIVPAAGDNDRSAMIVGFVVTGTRSKSVLVRAVGPTLGTAPFNVPGTLADPLLTLNDMRDSDKVVAVATSPDRWDATNGATLRDAMASVGAFPLVAGSRDAVIQATVPPGNYTAQTTSRSGVSGVVLVEVYDMDRGTDPGSRLRNLSTRGYTGSGSDVLIAGFVVNGPGPHTYLIRVAGPTLNSFLMTGTLEDPYLKLFNNAGNVLLRDADDWDSPAAAQSAISAATSAVGAFALGNRMESAMLVTLQPGNYTAQATGNTNGGTTRATGNTLIEIWEVP